MTYAVVYVTEGIGSTEEYAVDTDDVFYERLNKFLADYSRKELDLGTHWDEQTAGTQPLLTNVDVDRIIYALRDVLRHSGGSVKTAYNDLLSRFVECADKNNEGYQEWERKHIEETKLYGGSDHWRDDV